MRPHGFGIHPPFFYDLSCLANTMLNSSLKQLSALLAAKKISSAELTGEFLKRVKALNPDYNAFITVDEKMSLAQAQVADAMIASGQARPLTGIPIAQKDIFCTKGWLTTCGSKMLSNFVSPYDAGVIERFNAVGAVNIGKTNMDEFAMGSSTENSAFGVVHHPLDARLVPGGSSGGSVAAVAADLAVFALGSDTGGSIRQPASFCGVVGLKPTYGRVSRHGLIAMASSLDQIGPVTKTVEDAATVLEVIAGHDPFDATTVDLPVPNFTSGLKDGVKGLRVGVPKEYFSQGLSSEVEKQVRAAIAQFKAAGAEVVEVSLPHSQYALAAYYIVMPCEVSANLARFDGIRYGHVSDKPGTILDTYLDSRAEGFGAETKRRIMLGTYALSAGYFDAYYVKAQQVRRLIKQDFEKAFEKVDVIVGPTAPTVAFPIGEKSSDPLAMYLSDIYTVPVNLAGLPAISVPCGNGSDSGLPVGLHVIGKSFDEATVLRVAYQVEQTLKQQLT